MLFFQNNWIAPAQLEAGLSPDRVRYSGNMSAFISIATAAILCKGTAWIVHSQAEEKMPFLFQKPTKQWQLSLHLLDFFFFFFLKQPVGVMRWFYTVGYNCMSGTQGDLVFRSFLWELLDISPSCTLKVLGLEAQLPSSCNNLARTSNCFFPLGSWIHSCMIDWFVCWRSEQCAPLPAGLEKWPWYLWAE